MEQGQVLYGKQLNILYRKIIKENYDQIVKQYSAGESVATIANSYSVNRQLLSRILKYNNIDVRCGGSYSRKYKLNDHYFDVVDTEEKAYMLGFIYADGCNMPTINRVSIQLSRRDDEILKKFSNIMYGGDAVLYDNRKNKDAIEFKYATLNMYSQHLSQQMEKLGVVACKSYLITFPEWLDKSLYRHFIRGLIDGDGWIYLPQSNRDSPSVGLICTRQINDTLMQLYDEELGLNGCLCKANKQDFDIMCEIRVKNYHQCKILLDWLYKDATIYLERKHNLYLEFLSRYENLREQNR